MSENKLELPSKELVKPPEQLSESDLVRKSAAVHIIHEAMQFNATVTPENKPVEGTAEDVLNDIAAIAKYDGGKDSNDRIKAMALDGSKINDPNTHENPPYARPKVRISKSADGSYKVTACEKTAKPADDTETVRDVWYLYDKQVINGRECVAANLAMAYDMEGRPVPHEPVWIPVDEMCLAKALSQADKLPDILKDDTGKAYLKDLAKPDEADTLDKGKLDEAVAELPIMHGSDLHFGRTRLEEIRQSLEDNETAKIKEQLREEIENSEDYKKADAAEQARLVQEGTASAVVAKEITKRVNDALAADKNLNRLVDLEERMKHEQYVSATDLAEYSTLVCQTRFNAEDLKKEYDAKSKEMTGANPIRQEELKQELATIEAKIEAAKRLKDLGDNPGLIRMCTKVQNGELLPDDLKMMHDFVRTGNVNHLGELVQKYGTLPEEVKAAIAQTDEKTRGFMENNKWVYALFAILGIGAITVIPAVMQGMAPRR